MNLLNTKNTAKMEFHCDQESSTIDEGSSGIKECRDEFKIYIAFGKRKINSNVNIRKKNRKKPRKLENTFFSFLSS